MNVNSRLARLIVVLSVASLFILSSYAQAQTQTIYDVLKQDHKQVDDMLQQAISNPSSAKTLFPQIKSDLMAHMEAEESVFYPALEQKLGDLISEAKKEHNQIRQTLDSIDSQNPSTQDLQKLNDQVKSHVQMEETQMFTEAKDIISNEQAQQMADKFIEMKNSLMGQKSSGEMKIENTGKKINASKSGKTATKQM